MKIKIILLSGILSYVTMHSQNSSLSLSDVDVVTSQFSDDISKYACYGSNKIYRENFLDSVAKVRVNYFSSVLVETGKKISLYNLTNNIPKNSYGHSRYFGNNKLFREPYGYKYPKPLPLIERRGVKVTAEIMQQTAWTKSSEYKYTDYQLINMALMKMENSLGRRFIMDGYKESISHRNAIDNYAKGAYGTYTKAIISRKRDELENVWVYDVVIYNLTVFSKKICLS